MPKLPDATHMGAVTLTVADLDASVAFYVGAIGLQVLQQNKDVVELGTAQTLVRLVEEPGVRPKPARATGLYHFALLTPSREDLSLALKRLAQAENPLHGASDHLVSEALYLNDPDGHGIEIYRDRPRSEWITSADGIKMDTLPLDLQALWHDSPDSIEPQMAPATTMGHVHLHVPDLREASQFYNGKVGFDLMCTFPGALFVAAGGYHHHLGLNTWAGKQKPPEGTARLVQFDIHLGSAEAVGKVAQSMYRVFTDAVEFVYFLSDSRIRFCV